MITAQLPNGTKLQFPDGTAQSVIQGVVRKQLGVAAQPAAQAGQPVPSKEGGQSAGYGEIAATHAANLPATATATGGTLLQALGEMGRFSPPLMVASLAANALFADKGGAGKVGQDIRTQAQQEIATNQPYINPNDTFKGYASQAIRAAEEMTPGLVGSLVTRSPLPMLGQAGVVGGAGSYGEQRDAGRTPGQSLAAAVPSAAAEVAFEMLPIGILLKSGTPFLRRAVSAIVGEGASEAMTEAVQAGIEKGTISPNMTLGQYAERIKTAGIVGGMVGGGVSIPAHVAGAIADGKRTKTDGDFYVPEDIGDEFSPSKQLALPAPDKQLALPAPEAQVALPAPDQMLALPSPDYSQAPYEGAPIIAGQEGARFQTLPEKQAKDAEEQKQIDLGMKDVTRLSEKGMQAIAKLRAARQEAEMKEQAKTQKLEQRQAKAAIIEEQKQQGKVVRDTLFNFIAENGGIKRDDGGDVVQSLGGVNPLIPGKGRMVREKGKSLDYVREAAVEGGYLPEGSTIDDLLVAIEKEARGEPVRRPEAVVEPTQQDYINDLHIEADKLGVKTEGKAPEELMQEMEKVRARDVAEEEDPMLALERMEAPEDTEEDFDIPFDAPAGESASSSRGTLYSGFDPSLIKELLGTPEERAAFYAGVKKVPKGAAKFGKDVGGILGTGFLSIDDNLRIRAKIHKMPTINKIADMLYGGTADTYGEAVRTRQTTNHNKVERILAPIRKSKGMLDRTIYLLQNPKDIVMGKSHADNAAIGIARLLKAEREYMIQAGVEVGEVEGYFPRVYDMVKILSNENAFTTAARKAYKDTYPEMKTDEINAKAETWLQNVKLGNAGVNVDANDFERSGGIPKPNSLKERTLSKNADAIMKTFLVQDPQEVLQSHFIQTAKRAEFERRFNTEAWKQMKEAMIAEADARPGLEKQIAAHDAIRKTVADIMAATGNNTGSMPQGVSDTLSWVKMFGAMAMLPHATLSSLPEVVMPALRAGDVRESFTAFTQAWKAFSGDASHKELKEIAEEIIGVVANAASDMAAEQRMGGELGTRTTNKLMSKFFTSTGLHGFTEGMRLVSTGVGMRYIARLSKEIGSSPAKTKLYLRDLGIDAAEAEGFAGWVRRNNSGKVTSAKLKNSGKYEDMYKRALTRFVDQSVMKPDAVEKPRYASHKIGSMFYYLQSFLYGFQKNVVLRQARAVKRAVTEKGLSAADRAVMAAPLILTPIILGALQYGLGELRDKALDYETKRKQTDAERMARAISRTGYYGQLDPWINLFASLKYQREPATVLAGPIFGGLLDTLAAFANLKISNSENTNTQERQAAKQLWRVGIKPSLMAMATAMPGNMGIVLIQMIGHPQTEEEFVKKAAGKKKQK